MNRRIPKINELIKREISKIILKEVEFPPKILVTVTRVDTSPDLKTSQTFISAFPEKEIKKEVVL